MFKLQRFNSQTSSWKDVRIKGGFILPEYEDDLTIPVVTVTAVEYSVDPGILNTVTKGNYRWVLA